MKRLKLDENFPPSVVEIFRESDIDASSVYEQGLQGSDDDNIYEICKKEARILVTFDLDFANIIRYPSKDTSGILIVRYQQKITLDRIKLLCKRLAGIIITNDTTSNLFIVEDAKIRVRRQE
jgi:predicted nuclease of predicted toxin-antitoxin system